MLPKKPTHALLILLALLTLLTSCGYLAVEEKPIRVGEPVIVELRGDA